MNEEDDGASLEPGSILEHLKQMGTEISTLLKYDRTDEALQSAETGLPDRRDFDSSSPSCIPPRSSILTPEQMCSQLSSVLQSAGQGSAAEKAEEVLGQRGRGRRAGQQTRARTTSKALSTSASRKSTRTRRERNGDGRAVLEKWLKNRVRQTHRKCDTHKKLQSPPLHSNGLPSRPVCTPQAFPYVVEISPETLPQCESAQSSNRSPSSSTAATVSLLHSEPTSTELPSVATMHVFSTASSSGISVAVASVPPPKDGILSTAVIPCMPATTVVRKVEGGPLPEMTSGSRVSPRGSDRERTACTLRQAGMARNATKLIQAKKPPPRPLDYALLGRIIGQPLLTRFYHSFCACWLSEYLNIDLLDPLADHSNPLNSNNSNSDTVTRWLQVTQKRFHIDPELGPVTVARILISSCGVVKYQLLFPFSKTVFTRPFNPDNVGDVLSELSPRHVFCPGLSNYRDSYSVLGFHPSQVRLVQTPHAVRYDHECCPILHCPRFSKSSHRYVENMCKQCRELQGSIVKLVSRTGRTDKRKRKSSFANASSSNQTSPLTSASVGQAHFRNYFQKEGRLMESDSATLDGNNTSATEKESLCIFYHKWCC